MGGPSPYKPQILKQDNPSATLDGQQRFIDY